MAKLGMDLAAGAKLLAAEKFGDWFRDPWGWPELAGSFVDELDPEADLAVQKGSDSRFRLLDPPHFHLIEVPKSRLGARPAVVQDPKSRLAFAAATAPALGELHGDLPDWAHGWRLREGTYSSGGAEWSRYVHSLPAPDTAEMGLLTDLTSFFASISPARLEPILLARLGNVAAVHVIMDVVRAHDGLSTRSGLPQRSFASAALAHVVVQPIDDVLGSFVGQGVSAVRRWVDDISAEGDEGALFELLLALQERARQVGLELNSSKTHLGPASQTAKSLRLEDLKEIEIPMGIAWGARYEEPQFEPDLEILHKLEAALLASPTGSARTVAKAVLVSLSKAGEFSRWEEWTEAARSLPHVADALGRYFRGAAEDDASRLLPLADWFVGYQASSWGRLEWVASQYALVFPADDMPPPAFAVLRDWLSTSTSLQQLAIATQRLCSTQPALGRSLIRARVDRTADPLLMRVFALGLLLAGETQPDVEAILRRDARNSLLLRLLNETKWATPVVSADFDLAVTHDKE